jgi:uncharacterized repeat protein (TIGR03803 family)
MNVNLGGNINLIGREPRDGRTFETKGDPRRRGELGRGVQARCNRQGSGAHVAWAGNLYGTTSAGGATNAGVVYQLNASGQYTVLYSFTGGADWAPRSARDSRYRR